MGKVSKRANGGESCSGYNRLGTDGPMPEVGVVPGVEWFDL